MSSLKDALRSTLSRAARPIAIRAARAYISGPELGDALQTSRRLEDRGYASTIGYWNAREETPEDIAEIQLAALDALGDLDTYSSLKVPALNYRLDLVGRVATAAQRSPRATRRLHFDSHAPETQDSTLALADALHEQGARVGVTLPGRWHRSLEDADRAIAQGHAVRVVKGQWAEAGGPDPRDGFLAVVERLAGRASQVAVATHDPVLATEALELLRRSGTRAELELLLGLPMRVAVRVADALEARVRVYVPYGHGWLPYSLGQAAKRPTVAWWILKDALLGGALGLPRRR